jgi:hypothetical protein
MRIVVLGGYGNFSWRIRALAGRGDAEVIAVGRVAGLSSSLEPKS